MTLPADVELERLTRIIDRLKTNDDCASLCQRFKRQRRERAKLFGYCGDCGNRFSECTCGPAFAVAL